jgi:hypothetical protein
LSKINWNNTKQYRQPNFWKEIGAFLWKLIELPLLAIIMSPIIIIALVWNYRWWILALLAILGIINWKLNIIL